MTAFTMYLLCMTFSFEPIIREEQAKVTKVKTGKKKGLSKIDFLDQKTNDLVQTIPKITSINKTKLLATKLPEINTPRSL